MKKFEYQPPEDGRHRQFFPDGKPSHEHTVRNGQTHGLCRSWHENGQIAHERRYKNGRIHGLCKQWNEQGKLLGTSRLRDGTGTLKTWRDDGELASEISYSCGKITGRMRNWGNNGILLGERWFFNDRPISKKKYKQMCVRDARLPRFDEEQVVNTLGNWLRKQRKERRVRKKLGLFDEERQAARELFDEDRLAETKAVDSKEIISWLKRKTKGETVLDEMTEKESLRLARKLYSLGAIKVWAVGIESDPDGSQHSIHLIIALPNDPRKCGEIYKSCASYARPFLTVGSPAIVVGQKYMSVSLL